MTNDNQLRSLVEGAKFGKVNLREMHRFSETHSDFDAHQLRILADVFDQIYLVERSKWHLWAALTARRRARCCRKKASRCGTKKPEELFQN
jgi:hypothetical protein